MTHLGKVIAFTGHRSERLAAIFDEQDVFKHLYMLLTLPYQATCIVGMAEGFDTYAGLLCRQYGIPYRCAIPFTQHIPHRVRRSIISDQYRSTITFNHREEDYYNLVRDAKEIHILHQEMGYNVAWYFERDRWMVDHADEVIAAWDGVKKGGTWETIKYAVLQNKSVYNIITGEYYHG